MKWHKKQWNHHLKGLVLCGLVVSCGDNGEAQSHDTSGESSAAASSTSSGTASNEEASNAPNTGGSGASTSTIDGQTTERPPLEPFVIQDGICKPLLQPEPETVYEGDSLFAHIGAIASWGDDVYFAEYADFNDIPPRIARLKPDNSVDTLLDGNAGRLKVIADTLYFADNEGLKSLDLKTAGATPQALMTVPNVVDYDLSTVLYRDEEYVAGIVAFGAETLDGVVPLPEPMPAGLALFGDQVYYSDLDTVWKVGLDGQNPTALFPAGSSNYILAVGTDGNTVLFDNRDVLSSVPSAGGEVKKLGRAGDDRLFPNSTAAFEQYLFGRGVVYWVDDGSSFGWTALDGQSCGLFGGYSAFNPPAAHLTEREFIVGGDEGLYRIPRVD